MMGEEAEGRENSWKAERVIEDYWGAYGLSRFEAGERIR